MKTIEKKNLVAFILVTSLFFLWGIANNMTDTILSAFKRIMSMTDTQTSLIQFAFYGSYFCFALPAALYIRRHSYKSGVIFGLLFYSIGTILFFPAAKTASYTFYLIAIYILAGGCSILETTANPYIMLMGSPQTATRRLNIAQAFNPLGSITGILLSQYFILGELQGYSAEERAAMPTSQLEAIQAHELGAVTGTYMTLGFVLLVIMAVMLMVKMPLGSDRSSLTDSIPTVFRRLFSNRKYTWGVIAQFFYVGAQIGVWSFTIRIAMQELGISEADGADIYLATIICFSISRFIYTALMKYIRPSKLLLFGSIMSALCCLTVAMAEGTSWTLVIFLILISTFMALMFPTIYGIALGSITQGEHPSDSTIGASGLIMAILGGAVITPLQAMVSDSISIYTSYLIPMLCFLVIMGYSIYAIKTEHVTR